MPDTTPLLGLRTPEATDPFEVYQDLRTLAEDVESSHARACSAVARTVAGLSLSTSYQFAVWDTVVEEGGFTLTGSDEGLIVPETGIYAVLLHVAAAASTATMRAFYNNLGANPIFETGLNAAVRASLIMPMTAGEYIAATLGTGTGSTTGQGTLRIIRLTGDLG